ncbi:MAG: threonine aldolase family protein [Promethearchaeota archaeon]
MKIVDLRSDTVTKPSPEMWEALRSLNDSKIGDDVEGEDPTVNELEEKAAKTIGKEAAIFVTSGTQGNLVSLLSQTKPGDEVLLEELSHIYKNEVGSAARIGGLMIRTYSSIKGVPAYDQLQKLVRDKEDIHEPPTTLFSVENTHNYHGGVIIQPDVIKDIKQFSIKNDLKLHLDGARIFNAATALKIPVTEFTKHVDSVMFCLSKGLSCPVGSIVAGSKELITTARRYRKMLGGGMRQAGIIASFGLVALEPKWIKRLEEDHKNAKLLANGIGSYDLPIIANNPQTNIVLVELMKKTHIFKIVAELGKEGILCFNISKEKIRFVTHYGINEDDIELSIEKIGNVLSKYLK